MTAKSFSFESYVLKGMSYAVYLDLIKDLLSEGKTTGINQSEEQVAYAKLNFQRMERLHKTIVVNADLEAQVKQIKEPQTWLCITEGWCGDAAQNLPLFDRLASLNSNITLKLVLRDENLELIDRYLTNGGRAIPRVICIANGKELWQWGPRPKLMQDKVIEYKNNPDLSHEEFVVQLHTWYAHNKTMAQQEELLQLLK
jgi:hypothetical protein